jgi:hypothetical protein
MTPPPNRQWHKGTLEYYDHCNHCDHCDDRTCPHRAPSSPFPSPSSTVRLSIPFTWDLPAAHQRAAWLKTQGYQVLAGGPAVRLLPDYLAEVATIGQDWPGAVQKHNPFATFTTRGCIRTCPFCAVPRIEGPFRELDHWPVAPVVCDNNFLASSRAHFDRVVDRLKSVAHLGVDFSQGLDARLLKPYHARRLAELGCLARLAFDYVGMEAAYLRAFHRLRDAGFPKSHIRTYVLIGYNDTPEDALYRLRLVDGLGIKPFPMRYQPLDALRKNAYIAPNWTEEELKRYVRYWARIRYFRHIPFEEFDLHARRTRPHTMKGILT